jgi:hypothetical protein
MVSPVDIKTGWGQGMDTLFHAIRFNQLVEASVERWERKRRGLAY